MIRIFETGPVEGNGSKEQFKTTEFEFPIPIPDDLITEARAISEQRREVVERQEKERKAFEYKQAAEIQRLDFEKNSVDVKLKPYILLPELFDANKISSIREKLRAIDKSGILQQTRDQIPLGGENLPIAALVKILNKAEDLIETKKKSFLKNPDISLDITDNWILELEEKSGYSILDKKISPQSFKTFRECMKECMYQAVFKD
jgi:hypothetical protein